MSDPRSLLERESHRFVQADGAFERLVRRRDRKHRNQRIGAGALGLVVAIAVAWLGVNAIRSAPPVPADPPEELGIFAPISGWIVYGDARGIWGLWEIPGDSTGGFHIWPRGLGTGAVEHTAVDVDVPAPAIAQ